LIIFVLQDFMNEWLAEYGGIYCRSLANVSRIARSWSRVVSSAAAVQSSKSNSAPLGNEPIGVMRLLFNRL
jgi:hypothetical protein